MDSDKLLQGIKVASDPIQWPELLRLHRNPPEEPLNRSRQTELDYQVYKIKMKGKLREALMKRFDNGEHFRVMPSDFPYWTEDGIGHWLLWINPSYQANYDVDKIIKMYMEYYPPLRNFTQYVYYCNLPKNQSIPFIKHYHIFMK